MKIAAFSDTPAEQSSYRLVPLSPSKVLCEVEERMEHEMRCEIGEMNDEHSRYLIYSSDSILGITLHLIIPAFSFGKEVKYSWHGRKKTEEGRREQGGKQIRRQAK